MAAGLLRLKRTALLGARELEAIQEGVLRILETVGIEIAHPALAERARQRGFQAAQGRIRLSRRQVQALLDRARVGKAARGRQMEPSETAQIGLSITPSPYPQWVHDPDTDRVVPFTVARLAEASKLVDALAGQGVGSCVPGCPADVPPALQPIMQYRIGLENLRYWRGPVDPKSLETLPYVMEMAEVAGNPIRTLPVYVFSPLRLGGESLSAVMDQEERLESILVASMPSAGCSAPVYPAEAFALAAAEVMGAAVILGECIKPRVDWVVSLYSFSVREMAMSLGSPESLLFELASHEVDAHLHGQPWWPATSQLHTMAKLPGPQAAAEKGAAMAVGALLGGRYFGSAGTLSVDETFSPIQLLADLEIKGHVQRLVTGLDTECDLDGLVEQVQTGVRRGFLGVDRTLDHWEALSWRPTLFERRFLAPWQNAGAQSFCSRAREVAEDLVAKHDYTPAPELRRELAQIYDRAGKELTAR